MLCVLRKKRRDLIRVSQCEENTYYQEKRMNGDYFCHVCKLNVSKETFNQHRKSVEHRSKSTARSEHQARLPETESNNENKTNEIPSRNLVQNVLSHDSKGEECRPNLYFHDHHLTDTAISPVCGERYKDDIGQHAILVEIPEQKLILLTDSEKPLQKRYNLRSRKRKRNPKFENYATAHKRYRERKLIRKNHKRTFAEKLKLLDRPVCLPFKTRKGDVDEGETVHWDGSDVSTIPCLSNESVCPSKDGSTAGVDRHGVNNVDFLDLITPTCTSKIRPRHDPAVPGLNTLNDFSIDHVKTGDSKEWIIKKYLQEYVVPQCIATCINDLSVKIEKSDLDLPIPHTSSQLKIENCHLKDFSIEVKHEISTSWRDLKQVVPQSKTVVFSVDKVKEKISSESKIESYLQCVVPGSTTVNRIDFSVDEVKVESSSPCKIERDRKDNVTVPGSNNRYLSVNNLQASLQWKRESSLQENVVPRFKTSDFLVDKVKPELDVPENIPLFKIERDLKESIVSLAASKTSDFLVDEALRAPEISAQLQMERYLKASDNLEPIKVSQIAKSDWPDKDQRILFNGDELPLSESSGSLPDLLRPVSHLPNLKK